VESAGQVERANSTARGNDRGGHAAGDAVLKAVAQAITSNVRGSDSVARLGGDEFAVLLPGCDLARATAIAQKVRQGIADLVVTLGGNTYGVSASLGVAELVASRDAVSDWLAAADGACYEAKRAGRNTVLGAQARGNIRLVVTERA
jgi:diguanylate cyclase